MLHHFAQIRASSGSFFDGFSYGLVRTGLASDEEDPPGFLVLGVSMFWVVACAVVSYGVEEKMVLGGLIGSVFLPQWGCGLASISLSDKFMLL